MNRPRRSRALLLSVAVSIVTAVLSSAAAVAVNALTNADGPWPGGLEYIHRDPFRWAVGLTAAVALTGVMTALMVARSDRRGSDPPPPDLPQPPAWTVNRPREVDDLVAALRRRRTNTVAITTTLRGAGGFGKTTLATSVCADWRVRRYFRGRIYRVTLGQDLRGQAAIADKVNDLVEFITGQRPGFADPQMAGDHLARVLGERDRLLLLIDDVWNTDQLTPFLRGGDRTVRLITTRSPTLLREDAYTITVDQMSESQADQLLRQDLDNLDLVTVAQLVQTTGRWPLLLRLANRYIYRSALNGTDPSEAARVLLKRLRDLGPAAADDQSAPIDVNVPEQRARAVRATIEASTGLLEAGGAQRLVELGIFAEDEAIAPELVADLWHARAKLDPETCTRLAEQMVNLSLITVENGPVYRLHDVVRAFLRHSIGDAAVKEVNRDFLAALAEPLPLAGSLAAEVAEPVIAWWTLDARKDYVWRHLVFHLTESGQVSEAATLATDLRWITEKLVLAGPAATRTDLGFAKTDRARSLRRVLSRSAHLLAKTQPDRSVAYIFLSRLLAEESWRPEIVQYLGQDASSAVVARLPLPETPDGDLLRTIRAGQGKILALGVAKDGETLVTTGSDGSVRSWGVHTGAPRRNYEGHGEWVRSLAVGPDDRFVTGGDDGTIRLRDLNDNDAIASAELDGSWIMSVAMIHSESVVASTRNGTIYLYDFRTGREIEVVTDHINNIVVACRLSDSEDVVLGCSSGRVHLFNAATGTLQAIRPQGGAPIAGMSATADPGVVLICWSDGTAQYWKHGELLESAKLTDGETVTAVISPDLTTWVATGTERGSITLIDRASGHRTALTGHSSRIRALAAAPDGDWLASGSDDGTIRLWDVGGTFGEQGSVKSLSGPVRSLSVAGNRVYGVHRQRVAWWDAHTGDLTERQEHAVAVQANLGGGWLAVSRSDGEVRILDLHTGEGRGRLRSELREQTPAWADNGDWLALAHADGITVWNALTERHYVLPSPLGTKSIVRALAGAADGSWLAVSTSRGVHVYRREEHRKGQFVPGGVWPPRAPEDDDPFVQLESAARTDCLLARTARGKLVLFDMPSPLPREWPPFAERAAVARLGTGGEWIAAGQQDGSVFVIDTATGAATLCSGHRDVLRDIACSPDGRLFATASADRTIRIWLAEQRRCIAMTRNESEVTELHWLPDGSGVVGAGERGLYVFDVKDC